MGNLVWFDLTRAKAFGLFWLGRAKAECVVVTTSTQPHHHLILTKLNWVRHNCDFAYPTPPPPPITTRAQIPSQGASDQPDPARPKHLVLVGLV